MLNSLFAELTSKFSGPFGGSGLLFWSLTKKTIKRNYDFLLFKHAKKFVNFFRFVLLTSSTELMFLVLTNIRCIHWGKNRFDPFHSFRQSAQHLIASHTLPKVCINVSRHCCNVRRRVKMMNDRRASGILCTFYTCSASSFFVSPNTKYHVHFNQSL